MEPPPFLAVAAGAAAPAQLLAQLLEGLMHALAVLPRRHLAVGASQLAGQLQPFLGGHLPGPEQVALVGHEQQGDVGVGVDPADVLVQRAQHAEALVVRDGVDEHEAVGPVDGAVYLLLAADAVRVVLQNNGICTSGNSPG